jgi:hypothetical protein
VLTITRVEISKFLRYRHCKTHRFSGILDRVRSLRKINRNPKYPAAINGRSAVRYGCSIVHPLTGLSWSNHINAQCSRDPIAVSWVSCCCSRGHTEAVCDSHQHCRAWSCRGHISTIRAQQARIEVRGGHPCSSVSRVLNLDLTGSAILEPDPRI